MTVYQIHIQWIRWNIYGVGRWCLPPWQACIRSLSSYSVRHFIAVLGLNSWPHHHASSSLCLSTRRCALWSCLPPDGLLGWIHLLVLMNDTVIFAISHGNLCENWIFLPNGATRGTWRLKKRQSTCLLTARRNAKSSLTHTSGWWLYHIAQSALI